MFARVLEFVPKLEKKEEFINVFKKDVLPLLKKQTGFLEILPLVTELKDEKMITISLWTEKVNLERYEREVFPKVEQILKPFIKSPIVPKDYMVETALCEHFVQMLVA